MALAALPGEARTRPGDADSPRVLARSSDSGGATHTFAAACRTAGVGFSFGVPVDLGIKDIVDAIPDSAWYPAIKTDAMREGAWVAEVTGNINLTGWPAGSQLIRRKERPHPARSQPSPTSRACGLSPRSSPTPSPGVVAGLERRHRHHARVEDRIRQAKAAGLR